jgi:hypothetical protein
MMRSLACCLILTAALVASGCSSTKDAEKDRTPRRVAEQRSSDTQALVRLASTSDEIRTIQLYRALDERSLPIAPVAGTEQLALEFDLMADHGRALSARFYHADRTWRRDLAPGEFLETFHHEDLFKYDHSVGTQERYVHYRYRFPTDNIRFTVSGNYVLRVTEQGDDEAVLFEKAFFLTEQLTIVDMDLASQIISGQTYPSIQPIALFTPPRAIQANVFSYAVCFLRNGALSQPRCSAEPSLMEQPALRFYLQPGTSFEPISADYYLDLSRLQVGPRITTTDFAGSPYRVSLEPDQARFPASGADPLLNGNSVISGAVSDLSDPDIHGEYVLVDFSFVPGDRGRLPGDMYVVGSFTDWQVRPEGRLSYDLEQRLYTGQLLVKQGLHEYRYYSTDRGVRQQLNRGFPRAENLYTALVYYTDVRVNTDRLLSVAGLFR